MKKISIVALFIFSFYISFAQNLVLPPELQWWIEEVRKANPIISIDKFSEDSTREYIFDKSKINYNSLYPIFYRWNYSGFFLGYFNYGASIAKDKNGKHDIEFDIDSSVIIIDKKNEQYIIDTFGSTKGIDGIAWLRDNKMIGVGKWIKYITSEKSMVDLIIDVYQINKKVVTVHEYIFRDAFNNDIRTSLKMNWYQQRPDYFN